MMKVNKLNALKQLYSKFVTQAKDFNITSILKTSNFFYSHFEIERNQEVQCDYASKLFLPK